MKSQILPLLLILLVAGFAFGTTQDRNYLRNDDVMKNYQEFASKHLEEIRKLVITHLDAYQQGDVDKMMAAWDPSGTVLYWSGGLGAGMVGESNEYKVRQVPIGTWAKQLTPGDEPSRIIPDLTVLHTTGVTSTILLENRKQFSPLPGPAQYRNVTIFTTILTKDGPKIIQMRCETPIGC